MEEATLEIVEVADPCLWISGEGVEKGDRECWDMTNPTKRDEKKADN